MEEKLNAYIEITKKMTYEIMKEGTPKETTVDELEKALYEYFWGLLYENLKEQMIFSVGILIFLFKTILCLFIIYQIANNLAKYIDSRGVRIRSPIYIDEDF